MRLRSGACGVAVCFVVCHMSYVMFAWCYPFVLVIDGARAWCGLSLCLFMYGKKVKRFQRIF